MRRDLDVMRISVEEFHGTLGPEDICNRFTDLQRYAIEKSRWQTAGSTDIEFIYKRDAPLKGPIFSSNGAMLTSPLDDGD
jgi:hypothetical protein